MKLWELLCALFFAPAFWFGWQWVFRVLAVAVVGKTVASFKEKALSRLKGDAHANGSQTPV